MTHSAVGRELDSSTRVNVRFAARVLIIGKLAALAGMRIQVRAPRRLAGADLLSFSR